MHALIRSYAASVFLKILLFVGILCNVAYAEISVTKTAELSTAGLSIITGIAAQHAAKSADAKKAAIFNSVHNVICVINNVLSLYNYKGQMGWLEFDEMISRDVEFVMQHMVTNVASLGLSGVRLYNSYDTEESSFSRMEESPSESLFVSSLRVVVPTVYGMTQFFYALVGDGTSAFDKKILTYVAQLSLLARQADLLLKEKQYNEIIVFFMLLTIKDLISTIYTNICAEQSLKKLRERFNNERATRPRPSFASFNSGNNDDDTF